MKKEVVNMQLFYTKVVCEGKSALDIAKKRLLKVKSQKEN